MTSDGNKKATPPDNRVKQMELNLLFLPSTILLIGSTYDINNKMFANGISERSQLIFLFSGPGFCNTINP